MISIIFPFLEREIRIEQRKFEYFDFTNVGFFGGKSHLTAIYWKHTESKRGKNLPNVNCQHTIKMAAFNSALCLSVSIGDFSMSDF